MKSLNRLIYGAEVYGEEETKFRCARARARNSKTVWTVAGPGPYRAGRLSVWCGADWRTGHIILIGLAAAGPHSLFLIKISVAARFFLRLPKKVSQLENSKTRDTSKPDALSPAATSQNHCLWTSIGMQRGPLLTRRCQEGCFCLDSARGWFSVCDRPLLSYVPALDCDARKRTTICLPLCSSVRKRST